MHRFSFQYRTVVYQLAIAGLIFGYAPTIALGAELDTRLPTDQGEVHTVPLNIDIPSQSLGSALNQLGKASNLNIAYPTDLTKGKTSPAIKGKMTAKQALQKLLENNGLEPDYQGNTVYIKPQLRKSETSLNLKEVQVRAKRFHEIGPLPGLGLTKEQIPGNVQSITAKEIKDTHSLSLTDLLNRKLQSVNVNDYQGNPFQMDVTYRGFTAGPQIGTPQGLSVFFDGIRVNEPFGDVVNWDMIPMNAIAGVDVFPGSNPIFGLNTLGGAFTLKTKDGFTHEGVDAEVLAGSFGRKQLQVEGGWNNGDFALFGAGNFFLEDGWRENSPSEVNQFFGKASYRGDKLDLNLSTLLVANNLVGNGLLPSEEYARDPTSVFTGPDKTKNRLGQFQFSGSFFVNDSFTITGQAYRRNSKRHQIGADVFRGFENPEGFLFSHNRRILAPGEVYTCLSDSTNNYGLPDYYVLTVTNPTDPSLEFFSDPFVTSGITDPNDPALATFTNLEKNKALPADVLQKFQQLFRFGSNFLQTYYSQTDLATALVLGPSTSYSLGEPSVGFSYQAFLGVGQANSQIDVFNAGLSNFYYLQDPTTGVVTKNFIMPITPKNNDVCAATQALDVEGPLTYNNPLTGQTARIDGTVDGTGGAVFTEDPVTGQRYYTPTALFTDNQIDQIVDGASIQFNWNFEHHKFMVGVSIDAANASYQNKQRLGLLDANRKAYLASDQINPVFAGADIDVINNDFEGTNTTKSLYFSETWSPVDTWHFNASGRYNNTQIKNKVATRFGTGAFEIGELLSLPHYIAICPNGDCTGVPTGYRLPDVSDALDPGETEKFSYYSFNPSLGFTWQAKENLNIFANWAKGTRTPSVIELGCAFDKTPVQVTGDTNNPQPGDFLPKSLAENRSCSLPTTLSGDPYLPQIKATTYDIGMRGSMPGLLGTEGLEWNLGAYQTDLKNDIYFVGVEGGGGFFDSIGNTRRRGIEAGLSGRKDKWGFGINYGLTDATFEDNFLIYSLDNSSAKNINGFGDGVIEVKKGSRMPGASLHNLNANVSYEVTPKWQVGLSTVVHSESFVRGNENNEHKQGAVRIRQVNAGYPGSFVDPTTGQFFVALPPTTNPGKVPGYATFNFQTSYKFNSEWTATLLVNNLFDNEYFSAGRLGRNPFSPSILGAIGPDGYNHNSSDWLSTNFIAPGAPRGIWFSLNWQFDPKK